MDRRGTPKARNWVAPGNRGNEDGHCLAVLCGRHRGTTPRMCCRSCHFVACSPTHRSTRSAAVHLFWPAGIRSGRSLHLSLFRLMYCMLLACTSDRPFGRTPCRVEFEKTVIPSPWRVLRTRMQANQQPLHTIFGQCLRAESAPLHREWCDSQGPTISSQSQKRNVQSARAFRASDAINTSAFRGGQTNVPKMCNVGISCPQSAGHE
jgi:hypothetical protein